MTRQLRIHFPGAVCHLMSRGDRRDHILLDDADRLDFVKALAGASQKTGWQVNGYCVMRNQCQMLLETPNANLVAGIAWLQREGDPRSAPSGHGAEPEGPLAHRDAAPDCRCLSARPLANVRENVLCRG